MKIVSLNTPVKTETIKDGNCSQADIGDNPWINLHTGRLKFAFEDLSVGSGNATVSVSHVYSSQINSKFANKAAGFGKNWKLNLTQILTADNTDENGSSIFKYADGTGEIHRLVAYSDGWYDDRNAKVTLKTQGDYRVLIDGAGNKLFFNSSGYLCKSISCHNEKICKIYQYDGNNRLVSAYDQRFWSPTKNTAKTRIDFEYENGLLARVTSYADYTKKVCGIKYEYDSKQNLTAVYRVAYNNLSQEYTSKKLLEMTYKPCNRFSYGDSNLVTLINCQTKTAQIFEYKQNDKINKVSDGVIAQDTVSAGMQDAAGSVIGLGSGITAGTSGEMRFLEKSFRKYVYLYPAADDDKASETYVTNEANVTLAYFIDRQAKITASFEKSAGELKTLVPQREQRWISVSTGSLGKINGRETQLITDGKVWRTKFFIDLVRNNSEKQCRNFNYSFWLKTQKSYSTLEAKITYKFAYTQKGSSNTEEKEMYTTVMLNACAQNAWQKVSLPIVIPEGCASDGMFFMEICILADKAECKDNLYFNDIGFAPAPTSQMNFGKIFLFPMSLPNLMQVIIDGVGNNITKDFYLTEADVIATLTNKHNPLQTYDLIYNNCSKRKTVTSLSFVFPLGAITDENVKLETVTRLPTGNATITAKYTFDHEGVTVTNNCSKTVEDKTFSSQTSSKADYKGKTLYSKDEYDTETCYTYDSYGNVTQIKVKNGETVGSVQNYVYDIYGRLISSDNGISGQKLTYNKSDLISETDEIDASGNSLNHTIKNAYGLFGDSVLSVRETSASNTITYQNGRIRTVTDGTVKYGVTYDLENDRADYSVFDSLGEKLVQRDSVSKYEVSDDNGDELLKTHTSVFYNASGSEMGHVATQVDRYGKTRTLHRDYERFTCVYDADISESDFVKKPRGWNKYGIDILTYNYDQDYNLTGWKECENGKFVFEAQQIAPNKTKYIFSPTEEHFTEIIYDKTKLAQPRVNEVKIQSDDSPTTDNLRAGYEITYGRDNLGRVTKKTSFVGNYGYSYGNNSVLTGCEYASSSGESDLFRFKENKSHYSNGLLKQDVFIYKSFTDEAQSSAVKTYVYDNLHRITGEKNTALNIDRAYSYRKDGRLDKITDNKTGGSRQFFYDARGRLTSINNSVRYSYDNYGNRIQRQDGGATNYEYAYGGTLVKAGNTTYSYNADGIRYKKIRNGETIRYYLDGGKILGEDRKDCKLRYFYDLQGLTLIRHIKGKTTRDYETVLDANGNVSLLIDTEAMKPICRYEYDLFGKCYALSIEGSIISDSDSIANINPFRWKGYYCDAETGFYYANGSYYDTETGLYLDAAPIYAVLDNAYTTRNLDRNGIICNNLLDLAISPYNAYPVSDLSMDLNYDPGQSWWQKVLKDISNWWNGIPSWQKVAIGGIFVASSVALCFATAGMSAGVPLLGSATAGSALSAAAATALVELSIGIGFAVAGWALNSALTGNWDTNALGNDVADAVFFTGVFMFISSSVNAVKYVYRSDPYPTPQLAKRELTDAELKNFGDPGINQGFRQTIGTHDEAMIFVRSQTQTLTEFAPGKYIGSNSRGVIFRIYDRPNVKYPGPYTSIRIVGIKGLEGIKFMWP